MAHLHCTHERRVLVFDDGNNHTCIVHRSDGADCDGRYVMIGNRTFDPIGSRRDGNRVPSGTTTNALGPWLDKPRVETKRKRVRGRALTWLNNNAPTVERDC